jgi:hypothetical protein
LYRRRTTDTRSWLLSAVVLVGVGFVLAGCGTKHPKALAVTTTTPTSTLPDLHAAVKAIYGSAYANPLYNERPWAVVQIGRGANAKAVVFHDTDGKWIVDTSGQPAISILGPKPGSLQSPITQYAITMKAKAPILRSGIWLDGELLESKIGGSPKDYTLYTKPPLALNRGVHRLVGFAGTAAHGSAVTWTYRVR